MFQCLERDLEFIVLMTGTSMFTRSLSSEVGIGSRSHILMISS